MAWFWLYTLEAMMLVNLNRVKLHYSDILFLSGYLWCCINPCGADI